MTSYTLHACCLEISELGILIKGPSGSGKTSLVFGLIERAASIGVKAGLVSDDQTQLELVDDKLKARPPAVIAGKIELRGYGIIDHEFVGEATVGLIVEMTDDDKLERMPDDAHDCQHGVELPVLKVPARHEERAVRIVLAWLKENAYSERNGSLKFIHEEPKLSC